MKKLVLLFVSVIFVACHTHSKLTLTPNQMQDWSTKRDTIFHMGNPLAVYDHIEFELNPSHGRHEKPIAELSILQINLGNTEELIKYLHTLHGPRKIEVVVPREFISK